MRFLKFFGMVPLDRDELIKKVGTFEEYLSKRTQNSYSSVNTSNIIKICREALSSESCSLDDFMRSLSIYRDVGSPENKPTFKELDGLVNDIKHFLAKPSQPQPSPKPKSGGNSELDTNLLLGDQESRGYGSNNYR